jgi:hypothetical protein
VSINGGYEPLSPFGGFKQSGIGREYGAFGLEGFLEPRSVWSDRPVAELSVGWAAAAGSSPVGGFGWVDEFLPPPLARRLPVVPAAKVLTIRSDDEGEVFWCHPRESRARSSRRPVPSW